ncbi:hypothetical protein MBEHAL_0086 [Halarchaeum acidiphilum MH1-52-1]|uniref:Uncharacterized protein n=1 Tax=Halarchaeum acidiphilum MH1-52-1 TaxID=1261545 RepID=U2YCL9_9EURY|nr:hypothetical protein MBEHAL_0086 [Halarchaeum acidiphilum MH1-52-1]
MTVGRSGGDAARLVPDREGRRGTIRTLHVCPDESVLELCRFAEADARDVAAALDGDEDVRDHAVVDERTVYVHLVPGARVRALLALLVSHHLLLDTPVRFDAERVTVTLLGRARHITAAADDLPDGARADMCVERLAEYTGEDDLRAALTDRQREVLDAAVAAGYYEDPRGVTVADVADALGVSVSTASEHLRKIEARVLPRLAT